MALNIEQLFKARDFLELKNISATRLDLVFKNPVMAMLAKGKINEIASQCSPDSAFTGCTMNGSELVLTYNPNLVSHALLGKVFTAPAHEAQAAAADLAQDIAQKLQA